MAGPTTAEFKLVFKTDGTVEVTRLAGELGKLEAQAKQTGSAFSKFGADIVTLNQGLELLRKAVEGPVKLFEGFIDPIVKMGVEILNLSRRFGLSTETVSAFHVAAKVTGVDLNQLGFGLRQMSVALSQIDRPGTQAALALKNIGVTSAEAKKLLQGNVIDALLAIGTHLAKFRQDANLTANASVIFGRSVFAVFQLLGFGIDNLRKLMEAAKQAGLVFTQTQAESAERVEVAFVKVTLAVTGLVKRLTDKGALDAFSKTAEHLFDVLTSPRVVDSADQLGRDFTSLINLLAKGIDIVGRFTVKLADLAGSTEQFVHDVEAFVGGGALGSFLGALAGFAAGGLPGAVAGAIGGGVIGSLTGLLTQLKAVRNEAQLFLNVWQRLGDLSPERVAEELAATFPHLAAGILAAKTELGQFIGLFEKLGELFPSLQPKSDGFFDHIRHGLATLFPQLALAQGMLETLFPTAAAAPAFPKPLSAHGEAPGAAQAALSALTTPTEKPGVSPLGDPAAVERAAKLAEKLKEIADALDAARTPAKSLQEEIDKTTFELTKLGATKDQIALVRQELEATASAKFETKVEEAVAGIREKIGATQGENRKLNAELAKTIEQLSRLPGASERGLAPVIAAFRELEQNTAAQELGKQIDDLGTKLRSAGLDSEAKALADQLSTLGDTGVQSFRQIADAEARLRDPNAKLVADFDKIIETAEAGGNAAEAAFGRIVKAQALAVAEFERTKSAYFDVFQSIEKGVGDVFDALVAGTQTVAKAMEALKTAIVRSFAEAFLEGLKKKAGFEDSFKVNIVQFLGNLGNVITGASGDKGILGGLLEGVFGPKGEQPGGLVGTALSAVGVNLGTNTSSNAFNLQLQRETDLLNAQGVVVQGQAKAADALFTSGSNLTTAAAALIQGAGALGSGISVGTGGSGGGFLGGGSPSILNLGTGAGFTLGTGEFLGGGSPSSLNLGGGGFNFGGGGFGLNFSGGGVGLNFGGLGGASFGPQGLGLNAGPFRVGTGLGVSDFAKIPGAAALGIGTTGFTAAQRVSEFGFSAVQQELGNVKALQGVIGNVVSKLGTVLTIAGAIYAGVTTGLDASKALNKVERGAPEATNFGITSGLITGIATLVAGLAGGPLAAVVAGIVTKIVTTELEKTIAGAINKGTQPSRQGITQAQLNKEILGSNIEAIATGAPFGQKVLNPLQGLFDDLFTALLIPNIETILDKIFADFVQKLGFPVDRGLDKFVGQGVTKKGELSVVKGLEGDARTLSQFIAFFIGAGRDNQARLTRFTDILVNNIGRMGKSFEQGEQILFRVFRNLAGPTFPAALRIVDTVFPPDQLPGTRAPTTSAAEQRFLTAAGITAPLIDPKDIEGTKAAWKKYLADTEAALEAAGDAPRRARRIARDETARARATDFAVRAFTPVALGANLRDLAELFQSEPALVPGGRAIRRSTKAVLGAVPELFSGTGQNEIDAGIAAFAKKLGDAVKNALVQGIGAAFAKTFATELLAPFLADLRQGLRRFRRGNDPDLSHLSETLTADANLLARAFGDLGPAFVKLITVEKQVEDAIDFATIKAEIAVGDLADAQALIESKLQPFVDTFEGFKNLQADVSTRAAVAIAGGGFEGREKQIAVLSEKANRAQASLFSTAGVTDITSLINSDALKKNLPEALNLLTKFADARLTELEAEIDLARQQKQFFEQVRDAFRSLRDQVDFIRRGPRATRDIIQRQESEVTALLPKALAGDQEANSRIQALLGNILSEGQSAFAPGSQAFQALLQFVDSTSSQLGDAAQSQIDQANAHIDAVTTELKAFATDMQHVIDFYTQLSADALQTEFDKIAAAIGGTDGTNAILRTIAHGLGISDKNIPGAGGAGAGAGAGGGGAHGAGPERPVGPGTPATPGGPFPPPGGPPVRPGPGIPLALGGRAEGPPYLVGERGPELFVPGARTAEQAFRRALAGGPLPQWIGSRGPGLFTPPVEGYVLDHERSLATVRPHRALGGRVFLAGPIMDIGFKRPFAGGALPIDLPKRPFGAGAVPVEPSGPFTPFRPPGAPPNVRPFPLSPLEAPGRALGPSVALYGTATVRGGSSEPMPSRGTGTVRSDPVVTIRQGDLHFAPGSIIVKDSGDPERTAAEVEHRIAQRVRGHQAHDLLRELGRALG